eukprot:1292460-Prymnesium_polylepis.2
MRLDAEVVHDDRRGRHAADDARLVGAVVSNRRVARAPHAVARDLAGGAWSGAAAAARCGCAEHDQARVQCLTSHSPVPFLATEEVECWAGSEAWTVRSC